MSRAIFLCYRRTSASGWAGRLYDRLASSLGAGTVFMDVTNVDPGSDFAEVLKHTLVRCRAIIVIIGPDWLAATDESGNPRLENTEDYVRLEIEGAIRYDLQIYPVLIDGARMPQPCELPASLAPLAFRQAVEVTSTRFDYDSSKLIKALRTKLGSSIDFQLQGSAATVRQGQQPLRQEALKEGFSAVKTLQGTSVTVRSRRIDATPQIVWSVLADIEEWPRLDPSIVAIERSGSGPVQLGYCFKQYSKMLKVSTTTDLEVIEFVPPRGLSTLSKDGVMERFRVRGEGRSTLVEMSLVNDSENWLLKIVGKLTQSMGLRFVNAIAVASEQRQKFLDAAR